MDTAGTDHEANHPWRQPWTVEFVKLLLPRVDRCPAIQRGTSLADQEFQWSHAGNPAIDWSDVGREAERRDNEERPRRKQMNLDLPEDLKREFKAAVQQEGKQMRFVVEDLIRLYLDGVS